MIGAQTGQSESRIQQAVPAPVVTITAAPADYRDRYLLLTGKSLRDCPQCGKGHMVGIETFLPGSLPRGPPGMRS